MGPTVRGLKRIPEPGTWAGGKYMFRKRGRARRKYVHAAREDRPGHEMNSPFYLSCLSTK